MCDWLMKKDVNLSDVLFSESSFPLQISPHWPPHSHPSLPSFLHINQPCIISSFPTSVLSLSSICIRNRIWGTMLSYHRSESEREWGRKNDEGKECYGCQERQGLKENESKMAISFTVSSSSISFFKKGNYWSLVGLIGLTIGAR